MADTPVHRARRLRANQTDAERMLWRRLREFKASGFHFRRQAPIGPFVADFVCHGARLVIEVDGGQHATDEGILRDRSRSDWLESQGYRVLRFWNNDVFDNPEGVIAHIRHVLGSAGLSSASNFSPAGGEE